MAKSAGNGEVSWQWRGRLTKARSAYEGEVGWPWRGRLAMARSAGTSSKPQKVLQRIQQGSRNQDAPKKLGIAEPPTQFFFRPVTRPNRFELC